MFEAANTANINIMLERQGATAGVDATDLVLAGSPSASRCRLPGSRFSIRSLAWIGPAEKTFRIYHKPGNAYAFLPYGSYHARYVIRLKAETHRATPRSGRRNAVIFFSDSMRLVALASVGVVKRSRGPSARRLAKWGAGARVLVQHAVMRNQWGARWPAVAQSSHSRQSRDKA